MNKLYIKIIVGVIVVVILVAASLAFMTYIVPVQSPIVMKFSRMMPAIIIGNETVSRGKIEENVQATKSFYENQDFAGNGVRIDFTTSDGKKRLKIIEREVVNNLIETAVVESILKQIDREVGQDDVNMALARTIKEGGDPELAQKRAELYGWTLDEFAQNVIKKSIAQERLQKMYNEKNKASQEAQDEMTLAKQKLADGRDFATVAKEHSNGFAAENGGVQGTFTYSQLDPEIAEQVFSLEQSAPSDIIESAVGLHIFMVDNFSTNEDGEKIATINHIFQPKKTFEQYMNEEIDKRKVRVLLPDFIWDDKTNFAYFKDQDLRLYEQELVEEAQKAIEADIESAQDSL